MKRFSSKFVTVFLLFVMVFNQFQPAAALQNKPLTAAPVTGIASALGVAAVGSNLANHLRGMGTKAAKPQPADQPPAPKAAALKIKLTANPKYVTGNAEITVGWSIKGDLPADASALTLVIVFPDGYTPKDVYTFDGATKTLSLPVNAQNTQGEFKLNILNPMDSAAFTATLFNGSQSLANTTLKLAKHEKFSGKKNGDTFSAEKGRIKVTLGKNSLPETADINVGDPSGDDAPTSSLSGHPFEIDAQGKQSKQDLHQFADQVSIDVTYTDDDLQGNDPNNLYLYYYDTTADDWYALPTTVDIATKTIHAVTTHFTVFDSGINDWKDAHPPTVDSFQTSQFTGAATYSMPIEVPAGPAGLQPNINLSYNSQTIDQSTSRTQASWVGMGWSLDMNSISLDDHGTNEANTASNWTDDDTWSVNVNGISGTIVKTGTNTYSSADENFVKFNYYKSLDTWTVQDKSGNVYTFSTPVQTYIRKTDNQELNCWHKEITYEWFLTSMKNISGKVLTYTYYNENKTINAPKWVGSSCTITNSTPLTTATYPDTITYPDAHYRVRFVRQARTDYRYSWAADAAYHNFQRSRLASIFVEQDENGDNAWNVIRKYDFIYANDTPDGATGWTSIIGGASDGATQAPLWSGLTWNRSGKTTTLLQVKQYGVGGAGELPTAVFSYEDNMHLTRADNGYGGSVAFTYDAWDYTPTTRASQTYSETYTDTSGNCWNGHFSSYASDGTTGTLPDHCIQNELGNLIKLTGNAINTELLGKGDTDQEKTIRPGGFYRFEFTGLYFSGSGSSLRFGFKFNDDATDPNPSDTSTFIYAPANSYVIKLPSNAAKADVIVGQVGGGNSYVAFSNLTLKLLPSFYRVATRTVSDGLGRSNTWNYGYAGPAVNDDAHSAGACTASQLRATPPTCQQYNEKYSEFRGHSYVAETTPDGRTTVTNFSQSDLLKGRALSVTVSYAGKTISKTSTIYNTVTNLPMRPLSVLGSSNNLVYKDVTHNWITTQSEENRIFNADGTTNAATQTSYVYDATYGNQIKKTKSSLDAATQTWIPYRVSNTAYRPNTTGLYLANLPAIQSVQDGSGTILSQTLNVYDNNTTWDAAPTTGLLTAVRTWAGGANYNQVSYVYDGWGNRTSTTVYNGYGTSTTNPTASPIVTESNTFDTIYHTYPLTTTTPLGTTTLTYDTTLGQPLTQKDVNDVVTQVTYDSLGRMVSLIKPGDSTGFPTLQVVYYKIAYDTGSHLLPYHIELKQKVDANNNYYVMRHTYDGIGREIKTETGSGGFASDFVPFNSVDTQYYYGTISGAGSTIYNVTMQSAPYKAGENIYYSFSGSDGLGRPAISIQADGSTTKYAYDGLKTTVTDANQHNTTTIKDVWSNTTNVTPPTGPGLSYTYSPLGQLLTATRAGLTTTITYDTAGHKIEMSDPDMGQDVNHPTLNDWYYKYDALGNMIAQIDANKQATNLYYDTLNRLVTKTYTTTGVNGATYVRPATPASGSSNVNYTYGSSASDKAAFAIGKRIHMTDPTGSTTWTYDNRGRTTSEVKVIDSQTFTTSFTYNNADLQKSMTYPDGEVVTNTYDPQKMLDTVSGTANYVTDTSYDAAGRINIRTFGNSTQTDYDYNAWNVQGGRLKTVKSGASADPTSLQSLEYSYDVVGNISSIVDWKASQTQHFTYDALDRLLSADASGGSDGIYSENYHYNPTTGNLESKAGVTLNYDDVNHKHAVSSTSSGNTYHYDLDGNQTQRTVNGQIYNLTYDTEGHLVSVHNQNPLDPTATVTPTASITLTATVTPTDTVTQTPTVTENSCCHGYPQRHRHPYRRPNCYPNPSDSNQPQRLQPDLVVEAGRDQRHTRRFGWQHHPDPGGHPRQHQQHEWQCPAG